MTRGRRLAFVVPSLTSGGTERVVQLVSRGLAERGHSVSVITTTDRPDFYALSPRVDRIRLDLTGGPAGRSLSLRHATTTVARLPTGLRALARTFDSIDAEVVVGFLEHANIQSVLTAGERPVIVTEHTDPNRFPLAPLWRAARRATYPRASRLVSVSTGVDAAFDWIDPERRRIIHNPVDLEAFADAAAQRKPLVVAMGRLTEEKGFDLLIDAFGQTRDHHPDWSLRILGEGPERPRLEAQIRGAQLEASVSLPGLVENVAPTLAEAGIFALSSRYEGFGNVLIEAMAASTPIVSFDCPVGPADLIDDGSTGVLVPPEDAAALAAGIERLMRDPGLRTELASNALASVERFDLEPIIDQWEALIDELVPAARAQVAA